MDVAPRSAALPQWIRPQLTQLADAAPDGPMAPRNQIRRLPHAGAPRSWRGAAAHPQGLVPAAPPGLDRDYYVQINIERRKALQPQPTAGRRPGAI